MWQTMSGITSLIRSIPTPILFTLMANLSVESARTDRPQLHGDVFLLWITSVGSLEDTAYVDEVGFFQDNFSTYEIKGLYKDGFKKFLETMPVSPQGRLTTTWGELKSEHQ